MPVKSYKPTSPGLRQRTTSDFSEITKSGPEKSLTRGKLKTGGRDSRGHLTSWWRGGGHKKRYRDIDFKRDKHEIPAKVASIEYDPNRSARIALLAYADGEKRYIVAPAGLVVGQTVVSGAAVDIVVGNALPLKSIPLGTVVHNIELKPGGGGQMARSAGAGAQLMAKEGAHALLRVPSGELRREHLHRKGRPQPLAWLEVPQPRSRDESRRPPHGRRRGQDFGRTPSDLALGLENEGQEDAQQQADRRHDRQTPQVGIRGNTCLVPRKRVRSSMRRSSRRSPR